jgi:hypothetical protein
MTFLEFRLAQRRAGRNFFCAWLCARDAEDSPDSALRDKAGPPAWAQAGSNALTTQRKGRVAAGTEWVESLFGFQNGCGHER